ncbi:hypothetical protein HZ993_17960 [Rhodoferax sp. AJA081-3]|uniref:hypothetical protein n=1 Tax=Rhodoferax sp. AJA081-3 TaxID=2752316 RepID=UPI001ADED51D|nr:hypothetical protein [Rhodoferax sp. AJA081-3]QTN27168.1 hypothetical protein HZ993_17960 [Rhodoferax sp. AJA081-3]
MKANTHTARSWSTASFGGKTDTSPVELLSLGDHLGACKSPHGNLFALHCMAEATRGFLAARFMTTLTGLGLLVAVVALML